MVPRVLTQLSSRMATKQQLDTPRRRSGHRSDRPRGRLGRRPAARLAADHVSGEVYVPRVLRTSAALGWRFLVVVAALYVIGTVAGYLAAVVVPVAIALLLAALLAPAVHWLQERSVPRGVATMMVMVGGLALVGGVLTFVVVDLRARRARPGQPAHRQRRRGGELADQRSAAAERGAAARCAGPAAGHGERQPGVDHRRRADHRGRRRGDRHRDAAGGLHADLLPAGWRQHLAVPARRGACTGPDRGPTWPAAGRWPRWSATCGRPRWWPWWTRWPSGSGWPCWPCRWPCRWPRWSSSARSCPSSAP